MTCGLRVIGGLVRNWALYNTLAAQTVPLSRRCSFSHILFDAVRQIALKQYQVPALQPCHGEISHASAHIISASTRKTLAATVRYGDRPPSGIQVQWLSPHRAPHTYTRLKPRARTGHHKSAEYPRLPSLVTRSVAAVACAAEIVRSYQLPNTRSTYADHRRSTAVLGASVKQGACGCPQPLQPQCDLRKAYPDEGASTVR